MAEPDPDELLSAEEELLPADDIAALDERGCTDRIVEMDGDILTIILRDYSLPPGFDHAKSDLLLRLPGSWPDGVPDMFWLCPAIKIAATGSDAPATNKRLEYAGRSWQRWSRHIQGGWKQNVDGLRNYLVLVDRELAKAAA